jgi:hypothetical protein
MNWLLFFVYLLGYALCSGANVGFFAFSQRQLRRRVALGEKPDATEDELQRAHRARTIQSHLRDPNWTLAAILLTNVGFGVQLSQLSDSLFVGVLAIVMPVLAITVFGEFFSQATFLRFAGRLCALTSPIIWVLKWLTAPISWPLARTVDALLGREALGRLSEKDLLADLELELRDMEGVEEITHAERLDKREIRVLMNVAQADDELARDIGEPLDPSTVLEVEFVDGHPQLPPDIHAFARERIGVAHHPWFVLVDQDGVAPPLLLDADGFIRDLFRAPDSFEPRQHIFQPRVYADPNLELGPIISELLVHEEHEDDDVIDVDVVLLDTNEGRWILTGGDILGRFLRGVPQKVPWRHPRRLRTAGSKTS